MHDGNGAERVMQHGLADRAEQHSRDATPAPRAHDQQLRVVRGGKQSVARTALGNLPQDRHLGMLLLMPGDRLLELRLKPEIAAQASWRVGKSAHRQQWNAPEPGLRKPETQRSVRRRGSVDANHDGTRNVVAD